MKVMLDVNAILPTRAHKTDAGLDLYSPIDCYIVPHGNITVDTGVHVEIPHSFYGKIESKSGLNIKHEIVSCGGVIDEGYTGSIVVKLYNLGYNTLKFNRGDKLCQLLIIPCIYPSLEVVDHFEDTERGDNGFGSTGK